MSAPVTERVRAGSGTWRARAVTIPAQRGSTRSGPAVALPTPRTHTGRAATRAYARREDRLRRLIGGPARSTRTAAPAGRAQFVLLVMALLGVGLVATLWLSTAAAADSYRLEAARASTGLLSAQQERLQREVAAAGSATELARRAAALGMVPTQDNARLVVAPEGTVTLVGEPRAATAPAPVVLPAPPVASVPPVPPVAPGVPAPNVAVPNVAVPNVAVPNAADRGVALAAAAPVAPGTDRTAAGTTGTGAG